jgi:NADPH:quinone reductase-like Zn-dependent oxidoreductase
MKAVRIHAYGGQEVLTVEDAPMPEIGERDLLVRVVASAINPVDWKIRAGYLKDMLPYQFPIILGWDVSGVVEAVGSGVTKFKPGDAIYSRPNILRNGSYAEFIAIDENEAAFKPKTISHACAASLPLAGITAWDVLIKTANIQAGQRVLIHAGSGGVGSLAIQLAKAHGAHVVATTSGKNIPLVKSLGADQLVDYRSQQFDHVVHEMDVVFDTIGGEVQEKSWASLKAGGILVSIVSPPSAELAAAHSARAGFVFIQPDADVLTQLAALVDAGKMRPIIAAEFALEDIVKAHALSESGRADGKIVLHVGKP